MQRKTVLLVTLAVLAAGCQGLTDQLPQVPQVPQVPPAPQVPQVPQAPEPAPPSPVPMGVAGKPTIGPAIITLVPGRSRGLETSAGNLVAPVRVQIGPQPFVVESCSLKPGDELRIAIREPEGDAVLYTRAYRFAGGLTTVSSGEEWAPAAGDYEAELWVNGQLLDARPFRVQ